MTPEATEYLERYFDERKRKGEVFEPETPVFLKDEVKQTLKSPQLSDKNVTSILFRIVNNIPELHRNKKGRRHDIQINHGFRKRMNTILKLESKVNSNIAEKIMSHKNGLDGVYLAPTRKECFREFVKGVLELTIDDAERNQIEITKIKIEKSKLEDINIETQKRVAQIDRLEKSTYTKKEINALLKSKS
ncbi:MAG: hypothetical protein LVO36_00675 [Nitrosopumilus sp. (ex Thoosa mismalolli)]|nr:hypothetical protein [Nitrosopumilus sp. (ex Thoosa mismalolli)]